MKRYFYSDGERQFGPFTLEELRDKEIHESTLVWYQGLDEWTPAFKAPLVREELGFIKKPVIDVSDEDLEKEISLAVKIEEIPDVSFRDQHRMPKNWLVESILVTILCCQPFGIVGIIFAAQVEPKYKSGDREGAENASRMAGIFTKIGFFISLAFVVFYFMMILSAFLSI